MRTRAWGQVARFVCAASGVALSVGAVPLPPEPAPERVSHAVVERADPTSQSLTFHDGYWLAWVSGSHCIGAGERRCSQEGDSSCTTDLTFGPLRLAMREPHPGSSDGMTVETLPGQLVSFRCDGTGLSRWGQFGAACDGQRGVYTLGCRSSDGTERRVAVRVRTVTVEVPSERRILWWREATRAAWVTRGSLALAWIVAVVLGALVSRAHRQWAAELAGRPWLAATHRGDGVAFVDGDGARAQGFPRELPIGAALVELAVDGGDEPYRRVRRFVATARAGTRADLAREVRALRVRGVGLEVALVAAVALLVAWQWRQ